MSNFVEEYRKPFDPAEPKKDREAWLEDPELALLFCNKTTIISKKQTIT